MSLFLARSRDGLVYYLDGELAAYVDLIVGHRGIWVQPYIHPDTENVQDYLTGIDR